MPQYGYKSVGSTSVIYEKTLAITEHDGFWNEFTNGYATPLAATVGESGGFGADQWAGFSFPAVNVAKGTSVAEALLTLKASTVANPGRFTLYVETPASALFITGASPKQAVAIDSGLVIQPFLAGETRTIDLASSVSAAIAHANWVDGGWLNIYAIPNLDTEFTIDFDAVGTPTNSQPANLKIVTRENLDTIVVDAATKLVGAAEGYIRSQLDHVVADFFRRSTSWREFTASQTVTPAGNPVSLNPYSATASVINVLGAFTNGYPIAPMAVDGRVLIRNNNSATSPAGYYTNPYDVVTFTPAFTQDLPGVVFVVALKPVLGADVPTWVLEQFYEHLLNGLLARMYAERDKPYTNVASAETYGRKYTASIAEAKVLAEKGFTTGPSPWAFPGFAK